MHRIDDYAPALPGSVEFDEGRRILLTIIATNNKHTARMLRSALHCLAKNAIGEGVTLNLSDPEEPLGKLMAAANSEARKRGWL
jgi:hypothetical protein